MAKIEEVDKGTWDFYPLQNSVIYVMKGYSPPLVGLVGPHMFSSGHNVGIKTPAIALQVL